jgi:hypothetical protein
MEEVAARGVLGRGYLGLRLRLSPLAPTQAKIARAFSPNVLGSAK